MPVPVASVAGRSAAGRRSPVLPRVLSVRRGERSLGLGGVTLFMGVPSAPVVPRAAVPAPAPCTGLVSLASVAGAVGLGLACVRPVVGMSALPRGIPLRLRVAGGPLGAPAGACSLAVPPPAVPDPDGDAAVGRTGGVGDTGDVALPGVAPLRPTLPVVPRSPPECLLPAGCPPAFSSACCCASKRAGARSAAATDAADGVAGTENANECPRTTAAKLSM